MAMSYNTNLTNVVTKYLEKLNVRITRKGLAKQLEEDPFFPSLYCINHVLDKYKIPNGAYTINYEDLDKLETPFIAYCNLLHAGRDFVLVTEIGAGSVSYISNGNNENKVARSTFLEEWQKIVLVAEPNEHSLEPSYEKNLRKENTKKKKKQLFWIGAFSMVVLMCINFFLKTDGSSFVMAGFIAATKMTGCTLAVLLLIYEIDSTNSFVKNICTAGVKTDCDAILNGKASGIAGLKWSEAGFFYFAATFLFLFSPAISFTEKIPWLAVAALLVSPYIVFSIYYQYKIAKQWCLLCLAVQGVLLLELIWAIVAFRQNAFQPSVKMTIVVSALTSVLLPLIFWFVAKPILKRAKEFNRYKAAYRRLLYNPEQFNQLLQQQPEAHEGWQQIGINVGNPDAKNCIVKVCNPYCGPCAQMHAVLEKVIHENENIRLKIIFTAKNSEADRAAKPVKHLLAIAAKDNQQLTEQALDAWYSADIKNYESFAADYPMNGELMLQDEKIDSMDSWCRQAGISATPTVFINGRALPENYEVSELKNIL